MECDIEYEYVGCFADDVDPALNDFEILLTLELNTTCFEVCLDFKYFSLQQGVHCFCENDYEDVTKYGNSTNCKSGIGGPWANDVYVNFNRSCMFHLCSFCFWI